VCIKYGDDNKCLNGDGPLTFVTDEDQNISTDLTQTQLMEKINSGIGSFFQGNGSIVEIGPIFGAVTPTNIDQNTTSGENDLKGANATTFGYAY